MRLNFEQACYLVSFVIIGLGCRTCKIKRAEMETRKHTIESNSGNSVKYPAEAFIINHSKNTPSKTEAYIQRFKKVAQAEQKKYGIPASITLAQGILESGVGKSRLAAHHNNHFGIKCWCKGKKKDCVNMADDSPRDRFRIYTSAWHSYRHHSIFVKSMPLRTNEKSDYRAWAKALKKAGYATKSSYAQDLINLIERYNLQRFDDLKNT